MCPCWMKICKIMHILHHHSHDCHCFGYLKNKQSINLLIYSCAHRLHNITNMSSTTCYSTIYHVTISDKALQSGCRCLLVYRYFLCCNVVGMGEGIDPRMSFNMHQVTFQFATLIKVESISRSCQSSTGDNSFLSIQYICVVMIYFLPPNSTNSKSTLHFIANALIITHILMVLEKIGTRY